MVILLIFILLVFTVIAISLLITGIQELNGNVALVGFIMLLLCGFVLIFAEKAKKEIVIKVLNQEIKVDTLAITKEGKIVDIELIK